MGFTRETQSTSDPLLLHPLIRSAVKEILGRLGEEGLKFGIYESFRTPARQASLYSQGRTRPGRIITRSTAWESFHQFGLAADLVLIERNARGKETWSWDTTGEKLGWWHRMQELGILYGLEPISWEMPHLQISGLTLKDLKAGKLPGGGDESWWNNLLAVTRNWKLQPSAPEFLCRACSSQSAQSSGSTRSSGAPLDSVPALHSSLSEKPKC